MKHDIANFKARCKSFKVGLHLGKYDDLLKGMMIGSGFIIFVLGIYYLIS